MITSRGFVQEDPLDLDLIDDDERERREQRTDKLAHKLAKRCGWENDLPRVLAMLGLREQT